MSFIATILASGSSAQSAAEAGSRSAAAPPAGLVSVRYQVKDVPRAVAFYTERLGFQLELRSGDAFAAVQNGNLRLLLSGPGASGSRPTPQGQKQEPGGWNRILLYVSDLQQSIQSLEKARVPFRNAIESGPGGSQILIEDPDGNPIELHQPPH